MLIPTIKDLSVRPHYKCVAADETKYWNDDIRRKIGKNGRQYVAVVKILKKWDFSPKDTKSILDFLFPPEDGGGKIYTAHVFDANSITHCCELQGSYELTFLEYIIDFAWDTDLDTELRDSIEEEIREGGADEGISYVHTSNFPLEATIYNLETETDEQELSKTKDEIFEELLERLQCNGGCYPYLLKKL